MTAATIVSTQTVDAARARDLEIVFLAEWSDIDSRADVDRVIRNAPASSVAPRTRAYRAGGGK